MNTDRNKSLSSKKVSWQHWKWLCNWWEKGKVEIIPKLLLNPDISELLFATTHLQRAHLLSEYIGSLQPQVKDTTHLGGNSIKNCVDAIVRKMRAAKQPFLCFAEIDLGTQTMSTAPFKKPMRLKSVTKTDYTVERMRSVVPQIM